MPLFLRTGLRPERWLKYQWLPAGEAPADALTDLGTKDNALSVFQVQDPGDVAQMERIVIAVAAGSMNPSHVGYAIFDGSALGPLGIPIKEIEGKTPDAWVNPLHYDLRPLTAAQLAGLAAVIVEVEIHPILRKRVWQLIQEGLGAGRLDPDRMPPELRSRLKV